MTDRAFPRSAQPPLVRRAFLPSRRALLAAAIAPTTLAVRHPTPAQYRGDQQKDFLALLQALIKQTSRIAAFPVMRPCQPCRSARATLADFAIGARADLPPKRAGALAALLADPESYVWGATVALSFVPAIGFLFQADAPLAALIVTPPIGEIGLGRLILARPQPDPSLTFVTFNQSIRSIAQLYAEAAH